MKSQYFIDSIVLPALLRLFTDLMQLKKEESESNREFIMEGLSYDIRQLIKLLEYEDEAD